jgi:N-acetylmuramoyl-L-alanine amidase
MEVIVKIVQNFLPIGPARPGTLLDKMLAIVLHWPADSGASALAIRNFWAGPDNKQGTSAHCAIDLDGTIVQVMPWGEKAFHVGSTLKDPASGQIYTDLARQMFGAYASNPATMSPNRVTIGIEMCHADEMGAYTPETVAAAVELCMQLCQRYALDPATQIIRHIDVVGWKRCPAWYIDHPEDLDAFRAAVADRIAK